MKDLASYNNCMLRLCFTLQQVQHSFVRERELVPQFAYVQSA